MCRKARARVERFGDDRIDVIRGDALQHNVADDTADCVVSSFGLKTFWPEQLKTLATRVRRMLKPEGSFAFVEISVPPVAWLRIPFMFYVKHLIPWIGTLCLGNADNYRYLGVYTERFGDCSAAADSFRAEGLVVEYAPLFFGCATRIAGRRPGPGESAACAASGRAAGPADGLESSFAHAR